MKQVFRERFDINIMLQFHKALKIMRKYPSRLPFYVRVAANQMRAARLREKQHEKGIEVPPLLIISITRRCNLNCRGCYSRELHLDKGEELTPQRMRIILTEARDLGVSIVLLAGGEPLIKKGILDVAADFPELIFPVFTNGLLIDEDYAGFFGKNPHLIPVISLEGGQAETDFRRGSGVYQNFSSVIKLLNKEKVFWGISLTLTSQNLDDVLTEDYARELLGKGCRLFFYVEYVPVSAGSEELVLSEIQKAGVQGRVDRLMENLPGLFVAFPGDEDQYEGCLAAGRGFLHINPQGRAEPCPFAPFSDTDLRSESLAEALRSPVLSAIREQHHLLKEGRGGCALWANREEVQRIIATGADS